MPNLLTNLHNDDIRDFRKLGVALMDSGKIKAISDYAIAKYILLQQINIFRKNGDKI